MHWSAITPVFGLVGAGVAVTALAACASAADLGGNPSVYERIPAAAPPYGAPSWTGLYGGMQAGYTWANTDVTALWGQISGPKETFTYSTQGALGGLHLGYNRQIDRFVLGIETDLETGGASGAGTGTAGAVHTTTLGWGGSLRGRVGVLAGSSLLYFTAGLGYGYVTSEQYLKSALAPYGSDTQWKSGWTVGGGIEHALAANLTVRVEYRYTDLGSISYYSPTLSMRETSDITSHAVRGGISFRF